LEAEKVEVINRILTKKLTVMGCYLRVVGLGFVSFGFWVSGFGFWVLEFGI
jgi:hypothetical protein